MTLFIFIFSYKELLILNIQPIVRFRLRGVDTNIFITRLNICFNWTEMPEIINIHMFV